MSLTKVTYSMISGAPINLTDYGVSQSNTGAQNTTALATALAVSKSLWLPEGTYVFNGLPFTATTANDQGWTLTGASRDKTIIKATASTTNFLNLYGVGSGGSYTRYLEGCRFQNFTIDFNDAPNLSTSVAIRLEGAYNNLFENIRIKNITSTQNALVMKDGTYTTQFSNVDFGSTTGVIRAASGSSNQVTTMTFVNCQFAKAVLYNYLSMTFLQPVIQGSLTPKFDLTNTFGTSYSLTVLGGDIEHSGGGASTYMQFDASTTHVKSIGNEFAGVTTIYSDARLTNFMTLLDNGGSSSISNNGSTIVEGLVNSLGTTFPAIGSTFIYKKADKIVNTNPTSGGYVGWVCIVDSANTTGSISSGSAILTVASGTGIINGQYVNVYGAGTAGGILNTYIVSGGGTTTLTLFSTASTTVSGAQVTTPGQWKTYGLIS